MSFLSPLNLSCVFNITFLYFVISLRDKCRAFRASMGGVGGVFAWVVWVGCAWVACQRVQFGWGGCRANFSCMLLLLLLYPEKKILNVNFYKNEEMFKTDLNSDSKK